MKDDDCGLKVRLVTVKESISDTEDRLIKHENKMQREQSGKRNKKLSKIRYFQKV